MDKPSQDDGRFNDAYSVIRLSAAVPPPPLAIDDLVALDADAHHNRDSDVVFLPQRTSQETVDLLQAAAALQFNSFDGGERGTIAGRLREGGPAPVSLFSAQCVGLAVSAAAAGFCIAFFSSAFKPLFLTGYLTTYHASLANDATSLLQWPPVLSLFIGVLSDVQAVGGYQRKPYLVLGWLVASLALAAAAAVGCTADLASRDTAHALIALSVVASVGLQIVWVISLAITVEHAQRETAATRGHFQGAYFLVYYAVTAMAYAVTTRLVVRTRHDGTVETALDLREVVAVLAGSALVPIPFLVWFYHEERGVALDLERDTKLSMASGASVAGLSGYAQQKPVYRIYFFLCGVVFLINARNSSVDQAMLAWCGVAKHKLGNVLVAQATPKVAAVVVWKLFMINLNWRVLGIAGVALYALSYVVLTLVVALDAARGEWVFYAWTAVVGIPLGWFEVFVVILPTEVAGVGREGLAIGLVSSFMGLISIASSTLWDSVNAALGLTISPAEVAQDDAVARQSVVLLGVAYALVNLSSIALAPLLPSQKLDAQRWKLFGANNRPASRSLAGAFVLLLLYNLLASSLAVRH